MNILFKLIVMITPYSHELSKHSKTQQKIEEKS